MSSTLFFPRTLRVLVLNLRKQDLIKLSQENQSSRRLYQKYPTMAAKALSAGSTCPPQKAAVRIYSMRFCPFAQRTRLVAAHKNIDYEEVNINLSDKPDWFLKKNPVGSVPVVEANGKVVHESTATADLIDDLYPEQNRLTPKDPFRKAEDRVLFEYFSKFMSAYQGLMGAKGDDVQVKVQEFVKVRQFYEDTLKARKSSFFGGDQPAVIDFLLWPFFERLEASEQVFGFSGIALDKAKEPQLAAWESAMLDLPAVKKLHFDTNTHVAFMKSRFAGKADYDIGL